MLSIDKLRHNWAKPFLDLMEGMERKVHPDNLNLTLWYKEDGWYFEQDDKAANKTVMQRLILLGSFTKYHPNILATWKWYLYKHNRDKDTVKEVYDKLTVEWTPDKIEEEKQRQISEYKKLYPKRNKIPPKILNWSPKKDFQPTRDEVMALYVDDYTVRERLNLEKEYLGYYWHSPMSLYKHAAENSIKNAKEEGGGWIDVFVEKLWKGTTKKDKPYGKITVTDGLNSATVLIWEDELKQCEQFLTVDTGVRLTVSYDGKRGIFALSRCYPGKRSVQILPLSNSTELI
jgi:DNA polymerase III alpha subunit